MQRTIFNTPIAKSILRGLSLLLARMLGWKKSGPLPGASRYVIIVAPHTSNWDLFYGIIIAFSLKLDVHFMAKKELFRAPFGPVMRWLGGMPIDRGESGHMVEQVISEFNRHERLVIAVAPEGTRVKAKYWKTGFYHIAAGAHVPILLGFLDYAKKTGGAGPLVHPTGDIDADMKQIREFYSTIHGRYADKTAPASIAHKQVVS